MERVCFLGRVRPERLAEYRARHERVWLDQGFKRVGEIFHVD
jgi:L-rhamnose mutarotase